VTQAIVTANDEPAPLSPWLKFALAYSLIGLLLAGLASIAHWLLPYLANHPAEGASEAIARRIHRIQAMARGFGWLEYPLIVFGTVVEASLVLSRADSVPTHGTFLALYLALWCLQLLFWHKRPLLGKITTPRQQPVPYAILRLFHAGTNQLYATLAAEPDGRFGFHVHTGSYDLKAEKDGYAATQAVETVEAQDLPRVSLVLTPATTEPSMAATPVQIPIK